MVRSLRIELELVESGTARLPFKRDDGFTLLDQDGIIRLTDELDPTYRTIYPMIKERLGIKDTAHGLRLYVFSPLKPEDAPGRQVVSTDSFDALLATWREEKSEDDGSASFWRHFGDIQPKVPLIPPVRCRAYGDIRVGREYRAPAQVGYRIPGGGPRRIPDTDPAGGTRVRGRPYCSSESS